MAVFTRSFAQLSNQELLAEVTRLAASEHQATAQLIASLMELDARRIYLGEGLLVAVHVLHPGASPFRTRRLRTHRGGAGGATLPRDPRASRRRAVTLTTVGLLAPHLNPENHEDLLNSARHKQARSRTLTLLLAELERTKLASTKHRSSPVDPGAGERSNVCGEHWHRCCANAPCFRPDRDTRNRILVGVVTVAARALKSSAASVVHRAANHATSAGPMHRTRRSGEAARRTGRQLSPALRNRRQPQGEARGGML